MRTCYYTATHQPWNQLSSSYNFIKLPDWEVSTYRNITYFSNNKYNRCPWHDYFPLLLGASKTSDCSISRKSCHMSLHTYTGHQCTEPSNASRHDWVEPRNTSNKAILSHVDSLDKAKIYDPPYIFGPCLVQRILLQNSSPGNPTLPCHALVPVGCPFQ